MYKQGNEEASQAVVKASDANTMFTEMTQHLVNGGRDGGIVIKIKERSEKILARTIFRSS